MVKFVRFIYDFRFVIVLVLVVFTVFYHRSEKRDYRYSQKKLLMGTTVSVDICSSNKAQESIDVAYAQVWRRLEDIDYRMNVYNPESEVSRINNSMVGEDVVVGADTYYVLSKAKDFATITFHAFDISVWPLLKFWKESAEKEIVPTMQEVEVVKSSVGLEHLVLMERGTVKRLNDKFQIDLGGIAKGYAIDEVARILKENSFEQFYINAGGDIYTGGTGCAGRAWQIGIQDPEDIKEVIEIVRLTDSAVTTSGNYEQYFKLKNKKLSHIINPQTGFPQEGVVSATVIAPTALEADVLSTAISVLGADEGIELVESFGDKYAGLIFTNVGKDQTMQRFETENLSEYLVSNHKKK